MMLRNASIFSQLLSVINRNNFSRSWRWGRWGQLLTLDNAERLA
jgi:hypothetical protein